MIELDRLVDASLIQSLAWTLLHFVWQGAALGLLAFLLLRVVRLERASSRYVVGVATLAVMLGTAFVTFAVLVRQPAPAPIRDVPGAAASAPLTSGVTGVVIADLSASPSAASLLAAPASGPPPGSEPLSPLSVLLIVCTWVTGVVVLSCRLVGGWILTHRLAHRSVHAVSPSVDAAATRIAARLQLGRAVAVLQSGAVGVPTLIGWLRPVVLLPTAALAGLSPEQLQAILAHELAHVRRHDYLINLLQSMVETLLFYHPAVWWVSAQVREEREHCCDDLAVDVCGDRLVYVSALAELTNIAARPGLALAATDGSLVGRVRRLLGASPRGRREAPPAWTALALLAVLVIATGTFGVASARQEATNSDMANPVADIEEQLPPAPPAPPSPPAPPPVIPERLDTTPLPPAPPVPPTPEVPPPPVPESRSSGHVSWTNDNEKLSFQWSGAFRLSDDERDIAWLEEGATITITEGLVFADRVELRGARGGGIERRYSRNGMNRDYEPNGRAFLADVLQKMIRHSGMFGRDRVARFLKQSGPEGVLAEIDRLDKSSHVRRVYYTELIRQAPLSGPMLSRVLERVSVEITSDHDRAMVLAAITAMPEVTDEHRASAARAAKSIRSDYEQRRVLATVLAAPAVAPVVAAAVVDAATMIESNHERAQVLTLLARKGAVTSALAPGFLALVSDMNSSYEQRRVLGALAAQPALPESVVAAVLRTAPSIESGHERSNVLIDLARHQTLSAEARASYEAAAREIRSQHEANRALAALSRTERR